MSAGAADRQLTIGASLLEIVENGLEAGQRELADLNKHRLSLSGHPAAALLDYADDDLFLSPSLFAFFSQAEPAATLDQILFGRLSPGVRPTSFEARASGDGTIDLPGFGQLRAGVPEGVVKITPEERRVEGGEGAVACDFEEARWIEGTEIEVSNQLSPLFAQLLKTKSLGGSEDLSQPILRALGVLRQINPRLHRCLVSATRRLVTFSSAEVESFATLSAHGAAFFATAGPRGRSFFHRRPRASVWAHSVQRAHPESGQVARDRSENPTQQANQ